MLGSVADAEDVVQETWLWWAALAAAERWEVRDTRAYLVRIVPRLCLNRLRTFARRRDDYAGEWLPEPLLTSPDVAEDGEFAESVPIAMLAVLKTLLTDMITPDTASTTCSASTATHPPADLPRRG